VLGLGAIVADITERKQGEREAEVLARLAQTLNASLDLDTGCSGLSKGLRSCATASGR
jgi:hypothetical protein